MHIDKSFQAFKRERFMKFSDSELAELYKLNHEANANILGNDRGLSLIVLADGIDKVLVGRILLHGDIKLLDSENLHELEVPNV